MSEAQQPDFDVAIVGYGPVGGFLALQLAWAGYRVVVLERGTELFDLPRAVGFDSDSMRSFQRLGLASELESVLQPPRPTEEFYFTDSQRRRLFGMELRRFGPNGWRDLAFFDQPELEAMLREQVAAHPRIEVRLGCEVTTLEASASEVALRGRDGDAPFALRAAYVIGCDGASSFVRRAMGAEWQSLGYDQDWLVVDVHIGPEADLPLTMMQVCDPERLTTYVPVKDPNRRWEFQLVEGEEWEEMSEPGRVTALLSPWLPPEHYEIRRAVVYQFHAATASQWRAGRVLLAGDAAHQTPPFLGQGLNSGFRDAVCLGWKLPLVLSGECDPVLLDSYEAERGPHSRDLVDRAVGIGQLMETLAAREAGRPDPHAGAEGRAAPGDGELIPPIRGGTLMTAQIGVVPGVGRPLVQPRVREANGAPRLLDSLLGQGFALVGRSRADLCVGPESRKVLDRLEMREVALDTLEVVEGRLDPTFAQHPAVVVRPDRYVFGAVDERHDLDALLDALARALALR